MIRKFKGFFVPWFCWTDQDAVWETERNNRCEIPGFSPAFLRKEITQRVRTIQRNYAAAALDCSLRFLIFMLFHVVSSYEKPNAHFVTYMAKDTYVRRLSTAFLCAPIPQWTFIFHKCSHTIIQWFHDLCVLSTLPFPTPNTTNTVTSLRGAGTHY